MLELTPKEQSKLDGALAIPLPVRNAIGDRINSLTERIAELEEERDILCNYLDGEMQHETG